DLNVAPQNLEVSLDATILPAIDVVQDFNTQVVYTVTAENGDEQDWTVNVTVSAPKENDENAITAFELTGQTDVNIDDTTSTITVTVPNDTDLNTAPSVLNVSENATVNPAIGDVQDFSGAVTYTVTAENTDERVWTVNVNVTSSSNKSIDSFVVNEVSGTVNGTDISLTLPFGTDVTALSPEIEFFGQSVNPSSGTPTDFTNDVVYTVTADDNSTLDYTVAVIIAAKPNTAPTTEDFSVIVQQDSNNNSIDLSPHINDDDDGDVLTVSIISDFENGVVTVSGTTLIYTPSPGYNGGDTIVYTVDDGNGGNVRGAVNVTVTGISPVNQSPVARASADDLNITLPENSVTLIGDGSTDTSPGFIDTYLWTQVNIGPGDPVATISSPGFAQSTATMNTPGTYTFQLMVTDNQDATGTDTVTITVNAVPVTGITVSSTRSSIPDNEAEQFSANVLPGNADNKVVNWTSSNTSVATVNATTGL
ncbi:Ig-like domain-containing protein, partial [Zobellia nedashkovskayae]|uniref:Ig-like domain-containing protein n=1 Tax=Zobellia nedashkovskayae TaxID=2779510 RepID=UPI00188B7CE7